MLIMLLLKIVVHMNTRYLTNSYHSIEMMYNFKQFLINYAEENDSLLPGRVLRYIKG